MMHRGMQNQCVSSLSGYHEQSLYCPGVSDESDPIIMHDLSEKVQRSFQNHRDRPPSALPLQLAGERESVQYSFLQKYVLQLSLVEGTVFRSDKFIQKKCLSNPASSIHVCSTALIGGITYVV